MQWSSRRQIHLCPLVCFYWWTSGKFAWFEEQLSQLTLCVAMGIFPNESSQHSKMVFPRLLCTSCPEVKLLSRVWLCATQWMICNPPVFSVLEFSRQEYQSGFAIPVSRESSQPKDWTWVSCIAGRFFTNWVTSYLQISSVAQSCLTLCEPMNCSTPRLPVQHQLPEFTQTHAYRVSDAIQPSHPLSPPSPPALNSSQHQSVFQWVNSSHEVAKVLEFQLQHQFFQWTSRNDLL